MAIIDTDKIAQDTISAIAEKIKNLNNLNIIVAGKTGVGKSTLINSVFREQLADTGMGKPVTQHVHTWTKKGVPLTIYDTRGFELSEKVQAEVKKEIFDIITLGTATKDINKAIHCIWYCINTASNRIEPEEIAWIRQLSQANQVTQVPIIIVLTQSFSKKSADAMKKTLLEENLDVVQIVPVLADDYEIEDVGVKKAYGLDVLIKVMGEALPDELMQTLQNVQIVALEEKKRYAHAAVATASLTAVGVGATPIPFDDAFVLIPTQITMIATITVIFGFDINKSIITALLSSTLGSGGATLLGKVVVGHILQLIPGLGSVAGGFITATAAGAVTAALGEAYISIMEMVFKGEMNISDLNTAVGRAKMSSLFKENLQKSSQK